MKHIILVIILSLSYHVNLDSQIIADESIQDLLKKELDIDEEDIKDKGEFR